MDRWARIRILVATTIVGGLLAGVWLVPGGASVESKKKKTYSTADCNAIQNMTVDSSKGSGYFGKQAQAAADAFAAASRKATDRKLKAALRTMGSYYVDLGKASNVAEAAVLTAKGGKAYGKALKVYLKASVYCLTQITIPTVTIPSVTTPTTSSSASSTTSTSSASTSTSTSTSSPTTTTTTR